MKTFASTVLACAFTAALAGAALACPMNQSSASNDNASQKTAQNSSSSSSSSSSSTQ